MITSCDGVKSEAWAKYFGIPEYQCHKRVRAAKITEIDEANGIFVGLDHRPGSWEPDDLTWWHKHSPEVGGYLVFYADGYVSYSPAKAFEEGYTKL